MKKVRISCSYMVTCSTEVEVPDDFEFKSDDLQMRVFQVEDLLDVNIDDLIPDVEVMDNPSVEDVEFDGWLDVDFN